MPNVTLTEHSTNAAQPHLPHINLPTLILNAQNDPFLPAAYLPQAQIHFPTTYLLQPNTEVMLALWQEKGRAFALTVRNGVTIFHFNRTTPIMNDILTQILATKAEEVAAA